MNRRFVVALVLAWMAITVACGRSDGSPCTKNLDCASDNCVVRGGNDAGVCCVFGGCP